MVFAMQHVGSETQQVQVLARVNRVSVDPLFVQCQNAHGQKRINRG